MKYELLNSMVYVILYLLPESVSHACENAINRVTCRLGWYKKVEIAPNVAISYGSLLPNMRDQ